jgi:hypothetical protein
MTLSGQLRGRCAEWLSRKCRSAKAEYDGDHPDNRFTLSFSTKRPKLRRCLPVQFPEVHNLTKWVYIIHRLISLWMGAESRKGP